MKRVTLDGAGLIRSPREGNAVTLTMSDGKEFKITKIGEPFRRLGDDEGLPVSHFLSNCDGKFIDIETTGGRIITVNTAYIVRIE